MFPRMFFLTWLTYASFYLCRKNFSVLMPYLKSEQGYSAGALADVLFLYSLLYCIGQFMWGPLVDRIGARWIVGAGGVLSALCSSATGFLAPLALFQSANGLAQASGWPSVLKLSRDWFPEKDRGVTLAWWSTSLVVGGFAGSWLAAWAVEGGWRRGAWIPGVLLSAVALAFAVFARDGKPKRGQGGPPERLKLNRPLLSIAAMYFTVKLTRYAFLFWLPFYMTEALAYDKPKAGYASSVFELIGFLGVVGAGYVSDRFLRGNRFGLGAAMMFCLAALCAAYPLVSGTGEFANLALIALIGMFTFGPDTLMAAAAVQDVAPPEATAAAGGFVNGVGSLGQIVSPLVVAGLSKHFGWPMLFATLGAFCALGGLALLARGKDHR